MIKVFVQHLIKLVLQLTTYNKVISDAFNNLKDGKNNGKHINPFGDNGLGKKNIQEAYQYLKNNNSIFVWWSRKKYGYYTCFSASIEKVPKQWKNGVKAKNIFGNNNPG